MTAAERITVHGGGPAALITALLAARRGSAVRLLRRPAPPQQRRIDLLEPAAFTALARIGIAEHDLRSLAQPCPGVWSHWGREGVQTIDAVTRPHGASWAIDRPALERVLLDLCMEAGVSVQPPSPPPREPGPGWTIIATGRSAKADAGHRYRHDELIALVATAPLPPGATIDNRLVLEAAADGWLYGIAGPPGRVCVAIITDRQSLAAQDLQNFASKMVAGTDRIRSIASPVETALAFAATPLPCHWRPIRSAPQTVRIGDAQASYDPLAGRGLSEAILRSIELCAALSVPDELDRLEAQSRLRYQRYVAERQELYEVGRERFSSGFWTRRCAASSAIRPFSPDRDPAPARVHGAGDAPRFPASA